MSQNNQAIEELLTKGIENIYPNREFLEHLLLSGKKLRLYLGIDPTGSELHLGHAIPLRKLRAFQDLGHEVILLIGNFTALSGDPDKSHTRARLTTKEINANLKNYQKQIGKILKLTGRNAAKFKFNYDWLSKLKFSDVVEIASHFTVQQMLVRDLFDRRLKAKNPIALHEFLYPLMQAYDSVHLDVDGELGGNDQTFNMLAGRDLMKQMKNKEKFVLTTRLLVDATGKKMGKTEGNLVSLNDSPQDMFGKVMSWPDELILPGYELLTDLDLSEIEQIKTNLKNGVNPRDLKAKLAKNIITFYYDSKTSDQAEIEFNKIFRDKDAPTDIEKVFCLDIDYNLIELMLSANLIPSKSEGRRLLVQGGVTLNGQKITTPAATLRPVDGAILKVGKRKFVEFKIKK
jgi:tyrosyl-tRNA synthetase